MSKASDDPSKNYSPELLKELHILTRDGVLNQDSRRKLKQIEHLSQLCFTQLISDNLSSEKTFSICDVGAGKNYFSFLLWDRYFRGQKAADKVEIYAIESRAELSEKSKTLADRIGFHGFHPLTDKAENVGALIPNNIDLVVALHACDTATDDAILLGLKNNAKSFALVPCCQAEVATKLEDLSKKHPAYPLWRHGFHRREFGSQLTNVIRALFLEANGYKVRCTEFVGLEHSLKNEVILAQKIQAQNGLAQKALEDLLLEFPIKPYLLGQSL